MVDETALLLPMDSIRVLFEIDLTRGSAKRIVNKNEFWSGLVSILASVSKDIDVSATK